MTKAEFFAKYTNSGVDFDGYFGYQCMDLYRVYVRDVLGYPQSTPVAGAADVWKNYQKNYFEAIPNTPTAIPQEGDVIIWNKNAGGGFGHIAIFYHGDANSFVSFDQNWPVGSLCHFQKHSYDNVVGWLRPRSSLSSVDEALALAVLKKSFSKLPEDDPYFGGNLEGYVRGLVDEHPRFMDMLQSAQTISLNNVKDKDMPILPPPSQPETVVTTTTTISTPESSRPSLFAQLRGWLLAILGVDGRTNT